MLGGSFAGRVIGGPSADPVAANLPRSTSPIPAEPIVLVRRRTKLGPTGIEGVVAMSVVADRLTKLGVPYEVISHEQAYIPIDEALALGISAEVGSDLP